MNLGYFILFLNLTIFSLNKYNFILVVLIIIKLNFGKLLFKKKIILGIFKHGNMYLTK